MGLLKKPPNFQSAEIYVTQKGCFLLFIAKIAKEKKFGKERQGENVWQRKEEDKENKFGQERRKTKRISLDKIDKQKKFGKGRQGE